MIDGTATAVAARHKALTALHWAAAAQLVDQLQSVISGDNKSRADELYRLVTTHGALTSSLVKVISLEREMHAIDSASTMTPAAYKQYTEDGILATAKLIERERALNANGS